MQLYKVGKRFRLHLFPLCACNPLSLAITFQQNKDMILIFVAIYTYLTDTSVRCSQGYLCQQYPFLLLLGTQWLFNQLERKFWPMWITVRITLPLSLGTFPQTHFFFPPGPVRHFAMFSCSFNMTAFLDEAVHPMKQSMHPVQGQRDAPGQQQIFFSLLHFSF